MASATAPTVTGIAHAAQAHFPKPVTKPLTNSASLPAFEIVALVWHVWGVPCPLHALSVPPQLLAAPPLSVVPAGGLYAAALPRHTAEHCGSAWSAPQENPCCSACGNTSIGTMNPWIGGLI